MVQLYRFTFLGERWLAVEKEDGLLECVLPVCKTENMNVFKNRFFMNAKDNLAGIYLTYMINNVIHVTFYRKKI